MSSLKDKVTIITGAVGNLGTATARLFQQAGVKQQSGKIINVASRDGLSGSAGYAAYSASKSAVLRLTESLAVELKGSNINVNCIMPGTIDTPQNRAAVPNGDFSRWVEPAAIAEVILFLASDASRAVNGAALPVFGKG